MSTLDLLPDSRLSTVHTTRNAQWRNGMWWQPIYCANCSADGGLVPEKNMTFAFYLCNTCFEKWGTIAGTYAMPDEVFWQKVAEEQLERHGRYLTAEEMAQAITNESDPLSRLAKERPPTS